MDPVENRSEELETRLKQFEGEHNFWLKRTRHALGRLILRIGGNPVSRFIIANFTTRILAWLVVRFGALGMEKGGDAMEITYNWQKLAMFLQIPVHIEEANPDRVMMVHRECTMGFEASPRADKVCRATMNMDHRIIRRLGGKITVLHTISGGAGECRYIIERLQPGAE